MKPLANILRLGVGLGLALVANSPAHADDATAGLPAVPTWMDPNDAMSPISLVQGPGIKVGEGTVLQPQVGLETGVVKVYPQTIKNVRVREKTPFADLPEVAGAIDAAQKELHGSGRVVVRYSGTEALARVMVEAESEDTMRRITEGIAGAIERAIGIS